MVDAEIEDDTDHVRAKNVAVLAIDREAGEAARFAARAFHSARVSRGSFRRSISVG